MAYQNPVVGGKTGSRNFTDERYKEGKSIRAMSVWPDDTRIRAITVWFTGPNGELGESVHHGKAPGSGVMRTFYVEPGEFITNMTLFASKNGDRLGWIWIRTSNNTVFDFGATEGSSYHIMDTKSGIWVGVHGYAGDDIDNMGASFLYPIKIPKMVSVKYPTLTFDSGSINTIARSFSLSNNTANKYLAFHVDDNAIFTRTSSWKVTSSHGLLSYSKIKPSDLLQGQVIIPILKFNTQGKVGWESASSTIVFNNVYSSNPTNLPNFTKEQYSVRWGESTNLDGTVYRGNITNIPFDGYIEITPDEPTQAKYSIPISGSYSGVYYETF